jgi:hypothetical protein
VKEPATFLSPLEAYSHSLNGNDPKRAAKVLAKYMGWRWSDVSWNPGAPRILQAVLEERAWQRFSAEDPIVRQGVAAHCLFRAACYQEGSARAYLIEFGKGLVSEILNIWLQQRTDG